MNCGTGNLQSNLWGKFHFGSYRSNTKHKSNFIHVLTNSLPWKYQSYLNLHLHIHVHITDLKKRYTWNSPEHPGAARHHTLRGKWASNIIKRSHNKKKDGGNFSAMNCHKWKLY
jgi:hypothetical protein